MPAGVHSPPLLVTGDAPRLLRVTTVQRHWHAGSNASKQTVTLVVRGVLQLHPLQHLHHWRDELCLRVQLQHAGTTVHAVSTPIAVPLQAEHALQLTAALLVEEPVLWWPLGHGEQQLHELTGEVLLARTHASGREPEERPSGQHCASGGTVLARFSRQVGLRKVELAEDPEPGGASFFFRINDRPIFARGANWIPVDSCATACS